MFIGPKRSSRPCAEWITSTEHGVWDKRLPRSTMEVEGAWAAGPVASHFSASGNLPELRPRRPSYLMWSQQLLLSVLVPTPP